MRNAKWAAVLSGHLDDSASYRSFEVDEDDGSMEETLEGDRESQILLCRKRDEQDEIGRAYRERVRRDWPPRGG